MPIPSRYNICGPGTADHRHCGLLTPQESLPSTPRPSLAPGAAVKHSPGAAQPPPAEERGRLHHTAHAPSPAHKGPLIKPPFFKPDDSINFLKAFCSSHRIIMNTKFICKTSLVSISALHHFLYHIYSGCSAFSLDFRGTITQPHLINGKPEKLFVTFGKLPLFHEQLRHACKP